MKKIVIATLVTITIVPGSFPALAAPLATGPIWMDVHRGVVNAQYREERRYWDRQPDRDFRRPPPRRGWHNGYEGYREQRRGYRRHNDGWWYPLAAFGAGVVIGGALSERPVHSRPAHQADPRHVDWCFARYRSYRAHDNTYVPRAGVRAECTSPYF